MPCLQKSSNQSSSGENKASDLRCGRSTGELRQAGFGGGRRASSSADWCRNGSGRVARRDWRWSDDPEALVELTANHTWDEEVGVGISEEAGRVGLNLGKRESGTCCIDSILVRGFQICIDGERGVNLTSISDIVRADDSGYEGTGDATDTSSDVIISNWVGESDTWRTCIEDRR